MNIQDTLLNEQIRFDSVRVVDAEGNQKGIMSSREALTEAERAGLDLVLISKDAKPPVCRIIDWKKHLFDLKKKTKETKAKQNTVDTKEIQLRPNIDKHDLETKLNHTRRFIENGKHVKFVMRFRGRENSHTDIGMSLMKGVIDELGELVSVDKQPVLNGNTILMVLVPQTK